MSSSAFAASHLDSLRKGAIAAYLPLNLILLSAFTFRFLWMAFLTGTIDAEGACYARLAESLLNGHGYAGIATPGTDLMFPPLFPLMIAAVSLLTRDAELAGRLISVTMGTLLVLPVYFIALRLYTRKVAYVAAALIGLHPLLVAFSATVHSEPTYLTLVMAAVYWCLRCRDSRSSRPFVFAGIFFGLAYLVRPEALLYPFVAIALIAAYTGLTRRGQLRAVGLRSCLLLAVFSVLAAPYVTWLSAQTGEFRLEGKSAVNHAAAARFLSGMDPGEAMYGIDADLNETGIWMQTNRSVIASHHRDLSDVLALGAAQAGQNLPAVAQAISTGIYIGSPVLFTLFCFGLIRTKWTLASITDHLMILMVPGVATLGLAFIDRVEHRFLLAFIPTMMVAAANGLEQASASIAARIARRKDVRAEVRTRTALATATGCILLAMALVGVAGVPNLRAYDFRYEYVRDAAAWLDRFQPGPKTIMDTSNTVAYHAGGTYVHFPYADPATTLRYIAKKKVDFLVIREPFGRPPLQDWIAHGIPDRRAQLVYRAQLETPETLQRAVELLGSSYLGRLGQRLVTRLYDPRPLLIYKWNQESLETSSPRPAQSASATAPHSDRGPASTARSR